MSTHNDAEQVEAEPDVAAVSVNDRKPNWRTDGRLYLVRCFACNPERGTENYALAVSAGECAWCGWSDPA